MKLTASKVWVSNKIFTKSWELQLTNGFHILLLFLGWTEIQMGIHFSLKARNMEIHLPACFVRIGLLGEPLMVTNYEDKIVWSKK